MRTYKIQTLKPLLRGSGTGVSLDRLLTGIGSTEPSSFGEICDELQDYIPEKGDRDGWREFFKTLRHAEALGLVELSMTNGRVDSAILTEAGVARVKNIQAIYEAE